ncbi:adenylate kinase [Aeromicrobium flavum]|uniref:Adenylate kinase n=1 Tax=Aeromicrobium flavum TaxID=416568 RepID=A0A512HSI8_9ACTN|nr:adenylate kinase [Aeromicrobium flavum]GEO88350.1 adenylate kinase [Aeromicrobium flavum]
MTRLLIMGPPGAGKGTQAVALAARINGAHISTGDIFRENVARQTELGQTAQRYMDAGEYVPDEVTNAMVADRLAQDDARDSFLLDGYPRTLDQVAKLDEILTDLGSTLDGVVALTVVEDELIGRLLERAKVSGRSDDTEDVIRHRQDVYRTETEPLLAVYRDRGLLIEVDGMGTPDEVGKRIADALPA